MHSADSAARPAQASDLAIRLRGVGKAYAVFSRPQDRLKQMLVFGRRRYYQEFWALRGVDLEIRRGEAVGLVGRNGAGKSTFLQLVCGTLAPSSGTVEVNGRVAAMLELGAGFNPEFTGRENVHLAAGVLGLTSEQIAERYDSIAAFAQIGDFIDQPVKAYSSGMYARLAFAVAAHVDADVLIIDEILAVGDGAFQQKCMRFINDFRQRGTLLLVSHNEATIAALCDRAVWLDSGTVRASGPAKDVCHDYRAALSHEKDNTDSFKMGGRRTRPIDTPPVAPAEPLIPQRSNVIRAGAFDPHAPWFGRRGATITAVQLLDSAGLPIDSVLGGQSLAIRIRCQAHEPIARVLIGFQVRNDAGQMLFGDNTHAAHAEAPLALEPGWECEALFSFRMPFLPIGRFSILVAISDGGQTHHVDHHWIDEALSFSVTESHVQRGLVGVPMTKVEFS